MESRKKIANIAFYKFVTLRSPEETRNHLSQKAQAYGLKGTILIAGEGLNGMLAGLEDSIRLFVDFLKSLDGLEDILVKWSFSERVPFKRLLIKVKKEILTLRISGINPENKTAPYIQARDLEKALSTSEDLTLIDVRNDFEVGYGTFTGALNPKTKSFSEFPKFARNLKVEKNKKIITFCTGGIRCEKGAALLMDAGFTNVFQLEGGILEYLSQTSGNSFEGQCFVFDEREALNKNLEPLKP